MIITEAFTVVVKLCFGKYLSIKKYTINNGNNVVLDLENKIF